MKNPQAANTYPHLIADLSALIEWEGILKAQPRADAPVL